jgi:hypothetical protein
VTHYLPFTFEGWQTIRDFGQERIAQWDLKPRMIPMPAPGTEPFEEAKHLLALLGLDFAGWVIFARPANHVQVIHSDCAVGPEDVRALCALNVPIVGGPGSLMEWYAEQPMRLIKDKYGPPEKPVISRYWVPEAPVPDNKVEDVIFGEEPMLVDTYHPHRVIAADAARAVVSMRFVGNPSFAQVRDVLQRRPVE